MTGPWPQLKQPLLAVALVCVAALAIGATVQRTRDKLEFEVFELQHVAPAEARRMLHDLLGPEARSARIVADEEARQLLVRGSAATVKAAAELLKELDRPPLPKPAAPVQRPVVRTYRVGPGAPAAAVRLKEQLGERATVTTTGELVVLRGDEQAQRLAAELLAARNSGKPDTTPQGRLEPAPSATEPARTAPGMERLAEVAFHHRSGDAIRRALEELLTTRLEPTFDGAYTFRTRTGETAQLQFGSDGKLCTLKGPAHLVGQFAELLRRLDTLSENGATRTRLIRVRNVDHKTIRNTIRALRRTNIIDVGSPEQSAAQHRAVIQLASYQQQTPELTNPDEDDTRGQLRRPASDVEIQSLPDLDVIILRGRDPDLEELTQIIQEIERISEETAPEIEVRHLLHVRGESLQEVINEVLDDLTGNLQGRASARALVKPNAILLIGWGEAVKAVKALIDRLDRPVVPQTQVRVFALRYASVSQVEATLQQFLQDRGALGPDPIVTADTRTNSLIVNASPRDLEEVALLVQRLDVPSSESVNRGEVVRLQNTLASDIAATVEAALAAARGESATGRSAILELLLSGPEGDRVIRSGLLEDVRVTPDQRTNTLFVSGPRESLRIVKELIRQLDENPASSAQLKVFQITNSDAGELVQVLRTLFPAQTGGSTVPQLATVAGEGSLVPVRFSVDARTNTIIATGSQGDLRVVEALIRRLDLEGAQDRVNRVYHLRNSPALDVAQAVNEFLRSERIVQLAAPGSQNPFQQIETEVVVVPEPVRNSLLISATPRFFQEILELVEDLDEAPPQVLIQVVLAEVDLDNTHEFGVELGLQDSLLFDRSLLGDLLTTTNTTSRSTAEGIITTTQDIIRAATLTPGFDFNNQPLGNSGSDESLSTRHTVGGQALSHFSVGRVNPDLGYGGVVLSASSENVSVLIRALNQSKNVQILSRPQVMTLDNQPAFIQVGQRVPRITGTSINQIGQVNNIELENVGLILGVTPRISPDGMVVMEVDAEKSELGPEQDGVPVSVSADGSVVRSPRVNIATAQTTVSAASGQTIVIGGLITQNDTTITRRVPWLSDVPLLGELFKYDGSMQRRRELLIILTPHVVQSRADAEHLKQLEMSRLSWCGADVFEWITPEVVHVSGQVDDSGVPVIYPDSTPGMEWTETESGPSLAPKPDGELPSGSEIQQMKHEAPVREPAPAADAAKPPRRLRRWWPSWKRKSSP